MTTEATENKNYEEKICKLCKKKFRFYDGEKKFYGENGLSEPKKCPLCRRIEKAVKAEVARQLAKLK